MIDGSDQECCVPKLTKTRTLHAGRKWGGRAIPLQPSGEAPGGALTKPKEPLEDTMATKPAPKAKGRRGSANGNKRGFRGVRFTHQVKNTS